ncbi:MAG: helix-turn-helix transcriptional regulator [Bacilli bacterium]|nr:helix-turn-helix transcriptional regulator [Bacilli bacterium]
MFKDILINKNMTCYCLSKKSKISYTAINELYRGERSINACTVDVLLKLSAALDMNMDEIIKQCNKRNTLPETLKQYFWDVEFDKLDLINDQDYIISRLLTMGGIDGTKFIFQNYSYEEIKNVITISRKLDKKVASFFANYFKLNRNDMRYYQFAFQEWNR